MRLVAACSVVDGSVAAIAIALDTAAAAAAVLATATGCTYWQHNCLPIGSGLWTIVDSSQGPAIAFTAAGQRVVCLIESVKPKFN